jgi:hypothetical protein
LSPAGRIAATLALGLLPLAVVIAGPGAASGTSSPAEGAAAANAPTAPAVPKPPAANAPTAPAVPKPPAADTTTAPADPKTPAVAAFTLRISGTDRVEASFEEIVRKISCPLGAPDGRFRLVITPSPGEDGQDWSTIEIETPAGTGRRTMDRVYRLSGPCWAPDGSYFVYATGGIVKVASPEGSPTIAWQDDRSPRGGIFPAEARNFSWGTAMGSLRFLAVEDPRRSEPRGEIVTLHLAR